jgi:trigger factor
MAQYTDRDIDQDRLRQVVEEDILTEKTMKWLEEHTTIELVTEDSLSREQGEKRAGEAGGEVVASTDAAEASFADTQKEVVVSAEQEVGTDAAQATNQLETPNPAE